MSKKVNKIATANETATPIMALPEFTGMIAKQTTIAITISFVDLSRVL